jgi:flavodoxin
MKFSQKSPYFRYQCPVKIFWHLFIGGPQSSFGEQMKYVIVYFSRYGNGKKLVEHLAGMLSKKGETKVFTTSEAEPTAMPAADMYIFSAPQEKFTLQTDMRRFMKKITGTEGRKYGIINTHAMTRRNQLPKMEKLLGKKQMVKVAAVDFRVGPDSRTGNGLMTGWEAKLDEFGVKL